MLSWLKGSRWLWLTTLLAAGTLGACAPADEPSEDGIVDGEEDGASVDDIVNGDSEATQTKVKRQSIGNCWLYATASWVEGMHKRAQEDPKGAEELNISETYLTYWHWFEQIANGGHRDELSTGGSYHVAIGLIDRYGIMKEGDFLPHEANSEMSNAQDRAERYINNSLKNGALKERSARADRALVRSELDKAFGLDARRISRMNRVFGRAVTRTLDRAFTKRRPGYEVLRSQDVPVAVPVASTGELSVVSLADAIGTGSRWYRSGQYAHQEINWPHSESGQRAFTQRVQRALHDGGIPIMSWKVDFNALTRDSRFSREELMRRGPGRQGGHMVVIHDYQARLGDGTLLKAGEDASAAQLSAALAHDTSIEFFRTKNSWGRDRSDRWDNATLPGYHDLMWDYLVGPIPECPESARSFDQCSPGGAAWWDVVLPAGY